MFILLCPSHVCLQNAPVDERVLTSMRWGLVPSWFKENDPGKMQYSTSNCRSENILEKKSYKVRAVVLLFLCFMSWSSFYQSYQCVCISLKDPFMKGQRCVILADGFYEWQKVEKEKQPFFIYFPQTQGPCQEKKEDQDEPTTSACNKKNSKTVHPAGEASPGLTEVCIGFSGTL